MTLDGKVFIEILFGEIHLQLTFIKYNYSNWNYLLPTQNALKLKKYIVT
ncbi:Phytoene dehydrogenase-related protein [Legionella pneumophila subsp. pneumophila LPE509]|nr:Phytoene dehydrogenase-related protein [Legionella pneumophila subsp. pneumophila LPE509]